MSVAADNEPRRARSFAERALLWWLAELRQMWRDLAGWLPAGAGSDAVLEAGERYWVARVQQRPLGQIDRAVADAEDTRHTLQRLFTASRSGLTVEIPVERALVKRIMLPAAAPHEIDRVLRFEVARHFPFPAERVYFRHRVLGRGAGGPGTVEIELVAVPRETVAEILDELNGAGLRVNWVVVAGTGAAAPILLPVGSLGRRRLGRFERGAFLLLAILSLAALASPIVHDRLHLAAVERETRAMAPQIQALLEARTAQQSVAERVAAPLRLKASRPPLVAVLDNLTKAIPDGSWIQTLSLSGRELVIDGLSPSAATLALALEKSGGFTKVTFRTPIARDAATGLEHFQLSALVAEAAR